MRNSGGPAGLEEWAGPPGDRVDLGRPKPATAPMLPPESLTKHYALAMAVYGTKVQHAKVGAIKLRSAAPARILTSSGTPPLRLLQKPRSRAFLPLSRGSFF